MKAPVSLYVIAKILSPISSPSDALYDELSDIDIDDPDELRVLIQKFIVPHFEKYDYESQQKIRNSLQYFVCADDPKLKRIFPMFHIPFDEPASMVDFLSTLWEELFQQKLSCQIDLSIFEKVEDAEFANTLNRKTIGG